MTTTGKLFFGTLALLIMGSGIYYYGYYAEVPAVVQKEMFTINGEPIVLTGGKYEKESVPGSLLKTSVSYFGNEVKGDFNADGKEDLAFLVTETTGGSGSFFYLASSLGGEAVFLGDRISPQTTEYSNNEIIVNYADRKIEEPMTAPTSVGVSRYFKFENGNLMEIKKAVKEEPQATTTPSTEVKTPKSNADKCTEKGGVWSEQYKECGGIDQTNCTSIGGTFNECASPCRHDPSAQACVMMCVQICELK